jgi:predicted secreted Zn-dependent protease
MARLGREIDVLINAQNAEQAAFDKKEHRTHGPVEKSILALVKN